MKLKRSFLTLAGIGGLLWFFLLKHSGSSREKKTSISPSAWKGTLTAALLNNGGYSPRQAYFWFLVSNMETAGFTSPLFRDFNNPFGMKQPKKRATTSTGATPSGFAQYPDLNAAARDLALYLNEWDYPSDFRTLDEQIIFMRSVGYFGSETLDSYRGKVVAWANKFGYKLTA